MCKKLLQGLMGGGSQPEAPKPAIAAAAPVESSASVRDTTPTTAPDIGGTGRPQRRREDERRSRVPGLGL